MPFTLAHPAVTLPLKRLLPLSALAIGSMSPDFEYLFRLTVTSKFSHTFPGVFYFCIPVSFVILWLFHSVVKNPMLLLMPLFIRQRFGADSNQFSFLPLKRLILIICALAVGAFSHILWDSFTHETGWAVSKLPILRTNPFDVFGTEVGLYKILQHGSTKVGLSVMAYSLWKWFDKKTEQTVRIEPSFPDNIRHCILLALILLTGIIGMSIGLWSALGKSGLKAFQVFVVQSAIGGMSAFALCVLLFSLIIQQIQSSSEKG